ncbi:hypothetical protein C8R46DRAFT_1054533 [Mycena filopes]|nr:hypothetical protein C8R46DRAFT_1054533 [Mycena filopes]
MKYSADAKMFDSQSISSDRTLCSSPEPVEPPRLPCLPANSPGPRAERPLTGRVRARAMAVVAFSLWVSNFSLSLVEYFQSVKDGAPQLQLRVLLVWAICSGIFVVISAAIFSSTLLRRPSWSLVALLRGLTILMSTTSCIVGFAVVFPVIAECTRGQILCSSKERALRLFVCGGVPVASIWTWVWIPSIGSFLQEQTGAELVN